MMGIIFAVDKRTYSKFVVDGNVNMDIGIDGLLTRAAVALHL